MTMSNESRARIKKAFEPVALGMGRLGLTPDALTLIGFAVTVIGAVFISQQLWLAGGIVIFLGGAFDLFDGTLARATGKVSNLGAFMDSVFDRAGEAIVYVGVLIGCLLGGLDEGAILAASAMAAAFMVSYARAKAEGLGFAAGTGMAAVGFMTREARLVILSIGLILAPSPIHQAIPAGAACAGVCDVNQGGSLTIALGIITLGATITVIQRILHVRNQATHQTR